MFGKKVAEENNVRKNANSAVVLAVLSEGEWDQEELYRHVLYTDQTIN